MTWNRPVPLIGDRTSAAERADDVAAWAFPEEDRRAFHEVVAARRDIRRYRPDPVDAEVLHRVLAAAHAAPSVGHSQPWRFVVVSEPGTRERAARMAAEIGAASIVVCVDATRRSHAVASLLRALEGVGLPARRLAVHRAAESPDPLDVLSLDVPVGFLDGRPATSGAWAGLLLDAAGDHGMR